MPAPSTGKRPRQTSFNSASSITPSDSASNITDNKRYVLPASIKGVKGVKAEARGAQGGRGGARGKGGVNSRKKGVKGGESGDEAQGGVKREEAPSSGNDHASGGGGGGKARLSANVKRAIAQEIVRRGAANLDINDLCAQTGLTATQVRSQISDNRQNVRRQLVLLIETIQ